YGIGVGRDGFQWGGTQKISLKREWPDWVPPPEMIERQPYLPRWMAGGQGNPFFSATERTAGDLDRVACSFRFGHGIRNGAVRTILLRLIADAHHRRVVAELLESFGGREHCEAAFEPVISCHGRRHCEGRGDNRQSYRTHATHSRLCRPRQHAIKARAWRKGNL